MMAALFLLMTVVLVSIFLSRRLFAILSLLVTLALCWLMLWHHVTEALKINW